MSKCQNPVSVQQRAVDPTESPQAFCVHTWKRFSIPCEHLHGATFRWSLICAAIIVLQFYLPHYRKSPCSSKQRRRWLLSTHTPCPLSIHCRALFPWLLPGAQWSGSVRDVHITELCSNPQIMTSRQEFNTSPLKTVNPGWTVSWGWGQHHTCTTTSTTTHGAHWIWGWNYSH